MKTKLRLIVSTAVVALCATPLASAATKTTTLKSASTTTSTSTSTSTCPVVTPTPVFSPWGDTANYFLATGGSMENPTLWPGGSFVADNDPFKLSGAGTTSLRLLDGKSATSPWMCQGTTYPTMRFMVRNVGSATAKLNVLMYISGSTSSVTIGSITATSTWAPSPVLLLPTGFLPDGVTIPNIELAFSASGAGADFRIDDVFIDPRSRG